MHLGYLVLVATASLVINIEAAFVNSNAAGSAPVSSDRASTRLLRSATATTEDSIKDEEEDERAITIAGGLIRDSAQTKQWLNSLLGQGKSVMDVKALLDMNNLGTKGNMLRHINWNAYARYNRMKWEKDNGKIMAYAKYNSELQSKKDTHGVLMGWIVARKSVEDVRKYLGLAGLKQKEQLLHENWRAFKAYKKMFLQFTSNEGMRKSMDKTHYAIYGGMYRGIDETQDTMTKWAMKGHPVDEIAKTLNLNKLSGAALTNHENYRALETYKRYYKELEQFRTNRKGT